MPVLVTAAHRTIARRIALRLLQEGGEVRVYSDGDTSLLRAAGAYVATGTPDDEGRLEAALEQVHTLVHVGGGLAVDADRLVRDATVVARAASGAGVRRIVLLSLPGAAADADDPLRRAMAEVEAVLANVSCPTVVLRIGLVDTPALRDLLATAGLDRQALSVPIAPIRAEDLVEVVAAFDRARSRATTGHLVARAEGPRVVSVARYLEAVGVGRPGGGLVGRRLASASGSAALGHALAGPWIDPDPTLVDAWSFAGVTPASPSV